MNPFEFLQRIDELIVGFPERIFGSLIDYAGQILGLMILLYVIYIAISIIIGRGKNLAEVGWDVFWLGALFSAAYIWTYITDAVYGVFTVLPFEITSSLFGGGDAAVAEQLSGYWDAMRGILADQATLLDLTDVGKYLTIILLGFVPTLLLLGTATFWIVLSKFAIAVLFGLFPLFVLFAWSEKTREFFMGYLRQMFAYMLLPILIAITLNLAFRILLTVLQEFNQVAFTNFFQAMFEFAFATTVLFLLVMQLSSVASGIAGGMALGSMGLGSYVIRKYASLKHSIGKNFRRGANSNAPGTNRFTTDSYGRNRFVKAGASVYSRIRSGGIKPSSVRGE